MPPRLFSPGEPVLMRHRRDAYRWAAPMRVVEDRGDFVALYTRPGDTYVHMGDANGRPTRDFFASARVVPSTWVEHHSLQLIRFGDAHATVLFWRENTWEFRCWYVNFQEPLRRTASGFETMDLTLDMLIAPGRQAWQWKDEDEFENGIAFGWYTGEQLEQMKAYGLGVLEQARSGAAPFGESWPDWRPDAAWGLLHLPEDWDQ